MRRILLVLLFSMIYATTAMAQVSVGTALSYINSNLAVDPHGNLLIFDTTYSLVGTTGGTPTGHDATTTITIPVTTIPVRQLIVPSTKVTVIPGGTGKPISTVYSGTFEIVGAGKWALYAIATSYTTNSNNQLVVGPRELVAIDAGPSGTGLPTSLTGFLNTALNPGNVTLNASSGSAPDTLYNLEGGISILLPVSATSTSTPVVRVERTITFDGTRFNSTDIPLP